VLIQAQGNIIFANSAAGKILGIPFRDMIGRPLKELLIPDNMNSVQEILDTLLHEDKENPTEYMEYRIRVGVEKKWIGIWGIEIFYSGDLALLLNIHDLTQKKETELKLLQGEKMATIGQLAAGVAHEINNPVAFIKSNISSFGQYLEIFTEFHRNAQNLMQTYYDLNSAQVRQELHRLQIFDQQQNLDFILEDTQSLVEESLEGLERITKMVADIKNFSRIDKEEMEWMDINSVIESTINILWNQIKYDIELQTDYAHDLPEFYGNPQELGQIFMNIIINAYQAIKQNKKTPTQPSRQRTPTEDIRIKTYRKRTHKGEQSAPKSKEPIIVEISDNGPGIPEAYLQKIFNPFFTTKEIGEGTGLGLSICFDLVKKHGGEIKVESTLQKGTTFYIYLPLNLNTHRSDK
jgi:two-component system NtrC family sensor kinase